MQSLQLPGGSKLPNAISSSIVGVLKKHSAAIKDIVSAASPETLARHFEIAGLISSSVLKRLQATGLSPLEKASILTDEVHQNMSGTSVVNKFKKLCKILKENGSGTIKEIVMMLEREVGLLPEEQVSYT